MSRLKRAGPAKQKWTPEEESALREGVAKHGVGKWRLIQKDGKFAAVLRNRSNVDLKDKWRNLNMDSYTAAKEKARKRSRGVVKPSGKKTSRRSQAGAAARRARRRALDDDIDLEDEQALDEDEEDEDGDLMEDEDQDEERPHAQLPHTAPCRPSRHPVLPPVQDMVMAAVISLWHSAGSSADDVTEWVQDQYNEAAPTCEEVEMMLAQMVDDSQLALITGHDGPTYTLSRAMSEAVAKEESSTARLSLSDPDAKRRHQQAWPLQSLLQAAEAAAAAVREAEEAAAYAAQLCAAAEELEATG